MYYVCKKYLGILVLFMDTLAMDGGALHK